MGAQHEHHHHLSGQIPIIKSVEPQPLIAHAARIVEALEFVGSALPQQTKEQLEGVQQRSHTAASAQQVQQLLDPFVLAYVDINPESRVKVHEGPVQPILNQEGWTTYLVKVHNAANITAALIPESPNALPFLHRSTGGHRMKEDHYLAPGSVDNRFIEMAIYEGRPLSGHLSGLEVQYFLIQFYTRSKGKREVKLGFNVGQGTQDIGFRNTIDILFDIRKAVKVIFDVKDVDGQDIMASFTITDGLDTGTPMPQKWTIASPVPPAPTGWRATAI